MNRLLIFAIVLVLTNGASYITRFFQTNNEIKDLKKTVSTTKKALSNARDSVQVFEFLNYNLRQSDSMSRVLNLEKNRIMLDQRSQISETKQALKLCETWKAEAADGVVTVYDTVRVKKRFLRKGYKIVE